MKVRSLLMLGFLLGVCACAESPERHLNRVHKQNLENSVPSYADGYRDGCASAHQLLGEEGYVYRKDALRTQQDTLYSKGWQAGHRTCLQAGKKKQLSRERLHNRLYHGGRSTYIKTEVIEDWDDQSEEERAVWETLKK
jgi:hypothetical protein